MPEAYEMMGCPRGNWQAPFRRLDFRSLGAEGFERLACALASREGYDGIQRLSGGVPQHGLDAIAVERGTGFQFKNVGEFGPRDVRVAVDAVLKYPINPKHLVLVVSRDLSREAISVVESYRVDELSQEIWSGTWIEDRIRRYPQLLRQFFGELQAPLPSLVDAESLHIEQASQSAALGVAVDRVIAGMALRFVPAGCVEIGGRAVLSGVPFYLAVRPISQGEWRSVMEESIEEPFDSDELKRHLSVDVIQAFVTKASEALAEVLDEWKLDIPTSREMRYAMAAGSRDQRPSPVLGFRDFSGRVYQCCRADSAAGGLWEQLGGPPDIGRYEMPLTRSIPVQSTAGPHRAMGFRPVLRRR